MQKHNLYAIWHVVQKCLRSVLKFLGHSEFLVTAVELFTDDRSPDLVGVLCIKVDIVGGRFSELKRIFCSRADNRG